MTDFDAARRSLPAFAQMAGLPLADWQAAALGLERRVTVIVGPRQAGKSRALAVLALWWAYRRGGQRVLIVSAGEDASRRLLAEVRRVAVSSPLLRGSVVDEMAGLVTLTNASEVRSVPASERAIRGWSTDLLLADEAGRISDDVLQGAALPTTAARPDARVVLADVAGVTDGAFYNFAVQGQSGSEHIATYRWALTDCAWITPSVIAAARESMSELRFRAEYEGEFAGQADALFTREALERVTRDYRLLGLDELRGPARLTLGVDWGATLDRSAAVAIGRLPQFGAGVFGVVTARQWTQGAPLHDVVDELVASPGDWRWVASERNGMGEGMTQDLFRRLHERAHERQRAALRTGRGPRSTRLAGVMTNAQLKAGAYGAMKLLIDRERLLIPTDAADLWRELLLLRVELRASGTEGIEASTGHDDLADSTMLSLAPYRTDGGQWRAWIADLADPANPVPAPAKRLPAEIGREPVLQSVNGPEVTMPSTWRERKERPPLGGVLNRGGELAVRAYLDTTKETV